MGHVPSPLTTQILTIDRGPSVVQRPVVVCETGKPRLAHYSLVHTELLPHCRIPTKNGELLLCLPVRAKSFSSVR